MFLRSIEKYKLWYAVYVGDGDSSSFGEVKESLQDKYGDNCPMTKEDCQGHIQNRMGTNLRSYKNKAKGKAISNCGTVGGKGQFNNAAMVWYGMSLLLVIPTRNQNSAFSFELFSGDF